MGKPAKSMLCMVLYYLVIRMPAAWLLSAFGFGLNGIWYAVFASHVIAAASAAVPALKELKSQRRSYEVGVPLRQGHAMNAGIASH